MPRPSPPQTRRRPAPRPKVRVPDHGIVGDCPAVRAMLRELRRYAPTALPALVLGETGTGKELVARELHRASGRCGRFVAVSCPNLPAHLVESELFGHRRGAFTGAVENRTGAFEDADGGTLFLDEIGEMPMDVQAKVLRVLQEGVIRRLGDSREVRVDVRVVAATWRDLPRLVAEGRFREDLYNRMAYCEVTLPPLRERGHDVVLLARALMVRARDKHGLPRRALGQDAEAVLRAYAWPGNVRELERTLYRALATATGKALRAEDLRRALGPAWDEEGEAVVAEEPPSVLELLEQRGPMRAAEFRAALGVSKSTLGRLVSPLLAQGRVVREGAGAGTTYRLVVHAVGAPEPDDRWGTALGLARAGGRVTRGRLASELGVSERTALRVLSAMVEAGVLVEDGGRGRGAGYRAT